MVCPPHASYHVLLKEVQISVCYLPFILKINFNLFIMDYKVSHDLAFHCLLPAFSAPFTSLYTHWLLASPGICQACSCFRAFVLSIPQISTGPFPLFHSALVSLSQRDIFFLNQYIFFHILILCFVFLHSTFHDLTLYYIQFYQFCFSSLCV